MPQLRPYQQRTNLSGESLGAQPQGPNRGMLAASQAIEDVGNSLALVQRRDAANETSTALATLRAKSTERYLQAQQQAQPDAKGFTDAAVADFDSDVREVQSTLKSPLAKRVIWDQSRELRSEQMQRAMVWEAGTRDNYRSAGVLDAAKTVSAVIERDPTQWKQAIGEQMAAIDAMELPPERALELKRTVDQMGTEAAASGRAKLDPLGTITALKGGDEQLDTLTPEARHRVEARARSELVDQSVSGIAKAYESRGPDAAVVALERTMKDERIPDDLRAGIRSQANGEFSQIREQRQQEHADDLSNITRAIATETAGSTTHDQVDTLYKLGALSPTQRASMHASIDESMIRGARSTAGADALAAALAGGTPLDPNDGEQRKALTSLFNITTVGQAPGSPSWQAQAQALAQRTRVLPAPATAWIRAAIRSPNPEVAANAASFYGAVKTGSPDAVSELDDDSKAFAGTVNSMVESGTAPAQAVETARANVFDIDKAQRERREHAWKGNGTSSFVNSNPAALNAYIDRDFHEGWFGFSNPSAADANVARAAGARMLTNDFDELSQKYFLKTGDPNVARDLAWSDLKRVYGPSRVNGTNEMMAFPPERFGVKPEEIRTEVDQFLKSTPQQGATSAADVTLVPDGLTLRQAADATNGQAVRPSYALVTKTGDVVIDKDGVPLRYTIPTGEEFSKRLRDAQDAAAAKARSQIEEARTLRDTRQKQIAAAASAPALGELPPQSD